MVIREVEVLSLSIWKNSMPHSTLTTSPKPFFGEFGHVAGGQCIVSPLLVTRCIVEAKCSHCCPGKMVLKELNGKLCLPAQVITVKIPIPILPCLEQNPCLFGTAYQMLAGLVVK